MSGETVLNEIRRKIRETGGVDSIYRLTETEKRRATLVMEGLGYAEIGRLEDWKNHHDREVQSTVL